MFGKLKCSRTAAKSAFLPDCAIEFILVSQDNLDTVSDKHKMDRRKLDVISEPPDGEVARLVF